MLARQAAPPPLRVRENGTRHALHPPLQAPDVVLHAEAGGDPVGDQARELRGARRHEGAQNHRRSR